MGRGSGREALRRARRVRGVTRAAFGRRGQTRLRAPELPHHAARRAAPLAVAHPCPACAPTAARGHRGCGCRSRGGSRAASSRRARGSPAPSPRKEAAPRGPPRSRPEPSPPPRAAVAAAAAAAAAKGAAWQRRSRHTWIHTDASLLHTRLQPGCKGLQSGCRGRDAPRQIEGPPPREIEISLASPARSARLLEDPLAHEIHRRRLPPRRLAPSRVPSAHGQVRFGLNPVSG